MNITTNNKRLDGSAYECPYCAIDTLGRHESHCPQNPINRTNRNRDTPGAWECPRCHRINAPWLSHCDCSPNTITGTTAKMKFISGGSATYYDPEADEWKPLPFYNKYYSGIIPVDTNSATRDSGDGPSKKHYYDKSATED